MKKSILQMLLCVTCLLSLTFINPMEVYAVDDSDFENNGSYYSELCSSRGLSDEEKATCRLYSQWLSKNIESIKESVSATKSEINSIKANITAMEEVVNQLQSQIDALNAQIAEIEKQIEQITANIEALQVEIDNRNQRIDTLNNQIMERMVNIQPFVSLDKYIEFIMGATDFTDLLRRTSAVNEIMDYDTSQIKLLEEEKEKLRIDMEEQQAQRNELAEKEALIEESKATVQVAMEQQRTLINEAKAQQAALEATMREQQALADSMKSQIQDIADNISYIAPSGGWIYPVSGHFYISGGAWYYFGPGSASHTGVDFAASYGTPLVAPINGVVAFTHDGEAGYGYWGNWCGYPSGGGNTVCMVGEVGGSTYGVFYYHMAPGVYVSPGQVVSQGQQVGRLGSSGNSTGPHVHVDVYYLGEVGVQEGVRMLSYDLAFGAGWSSSGYCDNKGYAPCRLNPQSIFGVYYGFSY